MQKFVVMLCAALVVAATATAAFAHAHLVNAAPAAAATVTAPSQIRLVFSEGVEPKFSGLTLTSPGGAAALGPASVEAGHPNVLIVPVAKPLSPGDYTVRWYAVSVDTHKTQGTFAFTVK